MPAIFVWTIGCTEISFSSVSAPAGIEIFNCPSTEDSTPPAGPMVLLEACPLAAPIGRANGVIAISVSGSSSGLIGSLLQDVTNSTPPSVAHVRKIYKQLNCTFISLGF
ncbi:hypothetical protein D3C80_1310130 [compost metagenome]